MAYKYFDAGSSISGAAASPVAMGRAGRAGWPPWAAGVVLLWGVGGVAGVGGRRRRRGSPSAGGGGGSRGSAHHTRRAPPALPTRAANAGTMFRRRAAVRAGILITTRTIAVITLDVFTQPRAVLSNVILSAPRVRDRLRRDRLRRDRLRRDRLRRDRHLRPLQGRPLGPAAPILHLPAACVLGWGRVDLLPTAAVMVALSATHAQCCLMIRHIATLRLDARTCLRVACVFQPPLNRAPVRTRRP